MLEIVKLKAPAKLNLTLNIVGVLENNYHLMDMIMQSVSLYDYVEIAKRNHTTLNMPNSNFPINENNTALKAANLFFKSTGIKGGAKITVQKNIPVCAGMAGGSADAAAVLVGLNSLYSAGLSQEQLCEIGAEIGADVPFCIIGASAHVTGIGDIIAEIAPCPSCYFAVVMPNEGISTAKAFARYDKKKVKINIDTVKAINAMQKNNLKELCKNMANVLQKCSESKHNNFICERLKKSGALAALMTGSGAAVYGVFEHEQQAKNALKELSHYYENNWLLTPVAHGAVLL